MLAAFGAGFVQIFGGKLGTRDVFFGFDFFIKAFPKLRHHRHPSPLAVGNIIKLVFKPGGKMVIHVLAEMLGKEFVYHFAGVGGQEALLLQGNVFAVFEGGNNAGIGRRAADAEFFQRFDQAGLGIARRRLGEVLLAVELVYRQAFAFFQLRQFFVVFVVVRIVHALFIHAEKTGKSLHLAGNAENAFAHHNIHGGGVKTRRCHLTGYGALPNHLIELELLGTQKRLYRFRRAVHRSGADGFVRFLCIFGFGFVDFGAGGQIIGTDFIVDVMTDFGDGIV